MNNNNFIHHKHQQIDEIKEHDDGNKVDNLQQQQQQEVVIEQQQNHNNKSLSAISLSLSSSIVFKLWVIKKNNDSSTLIPEIGPSVFWFGQFWKLFKM